MAALPQISLYVLPTSHPCNTVEEMLQLKGLDYRTIELPLVLSKAHQKVVFGKPTVPAIKVGGMRVVGSREISHALDTLAPEPALFPSDPEQRAKVEEIETWGDEVLQAVARRVSIASAGIDPLIAITYQEGAKFAIPEPVAKTVGPAIISIYRSLNNASDEQVTSDIAELPDLLRQVDEWIDEGVIGQPEPNAADLQLGSSIGLLQTIGDLEPLIAEYKAAKLGERFAKFNTGHVPAGTLPSSWLGGSARPTATATS